MKKRYFLAVLLILLFLFLWKQLYPDVLPIQSPPGVTEQIQKQSPSEASRTVSVEEVYMTKNVTAKGSFLGDFRGMTLYTYARDNNRQSNCYDKCVRLWPPYLSRFPEKSLFPVYVSVIKRNDGAFQYTWKGMPLYYYSQDNKTGDLKGDGFDGIWHIVKI